MSREQAFPEAPGRFLFATHGPYESHKATPAFKGGEGKNKNPASPNSTGSGSGRQRGTKTQASFPGWGTNASLGFRGLRGAGRHSFILRNSPLEQAHPSSRRRVKGDTPMVRAPDGRHTGPPVPDLGSLRNPGPCLRTSWVGCYLPQVLQGTRTRSHPCRLPFSRHGHCLSAAPSSPSLRLRGELPCSCRVPRAQPASPACHTLEFALDGQVIADIY